MNNKLIKTVIIVNGFLLFFVLLFCLIKISKEFLPHTNSRNEGLYIEEEHINNGEQKKTTLQGLKYNNPISLYNSKNSYLPISLLTYEEEKEIIKSSSLANDIGDALLKYVNVVFLDENYQVICSLLNKKASILKIETQRNKYYNDDNEGKIDNTVKHIAYLIAFTDSNKDDKLNSADHHDLYISALDGKNLKKVTNNIEIDDFRFINANSQIFIRYKKREKIREEHKKIEFSIYDIYKGKFIDLSSFNKELDKLEQIIIN